jgi:uncharacterized membrane protein
MTQRLIPILVGVGSIVLLVLTVIHNSEAHFAVLLLVGLLLLLRNLFAATRPKQDSPVSSRLSSGIGLLFIYYAVLEWFKGKRAVSESVLGVMALLGVVGIWVVLRYMWRASRTKRGVGPRGRRKSA